MLREQREHMFYELATDTGVIDEGYFMEAEENIGVLAKIKEVIRKLIKKIHDFFLVKK